MVNVGSTSSILSAVPVCCNGALSSNVYDTEDGDLVLGSAMASVLTASAGATTAVDFVIDPVAAAISATPLELNVAAAVRVARSAA